MARADGAQPALRESRFVTFDGAVTASGLHQRPDRYRHLEADFGARRRIARGAGLSYAAASFGHDAIVQEMTAFDRMLAFDAAARTIRVEAGLSVGALLEWAAGAGLFFPVLPGYPSITVGGCIAADVHGKNPARDGTFCDWVDALTLYHPAHGFRSIDRTQEPELFAVTCGGYGLTGLIVDATLRLAPLPARNVGIRRAAVASLAEAGARLSGDSDSDFAYSWHDGAARRSAFGRGVLFFGAWTDEPCDSPVRDCRPMTAQRRAQFPFALWNRASVPLANAAFGRLALRRPARTVSAFDAAFPFARQTLYHRFYGNPGLAEVQVLVPDANLDGFVRELAALVHRVDPRLVMMSMKRYTGRQRSLGMSGAGSLVALDLVRDAATARFLGDFDALTLDARAQPNVAKDSRLPVRIAARALPHYDSFRARLHAFDPARLYGSELSRRLEL